MNSITLKRFWIFASIAFVLVWLSACMAEKRTAMSEKQLFESVKTGMGRVDVEKLLGTPVLEVGSEVYYGKRPKIEKWQSPPAPTSISVVYSAENIVQSKKFHAGSE